MRRRPPATRSLFLALALVASVLTRGGHSQGGGSFEPLGLQADRGYFSQLPFESIDMVTGNLVLSFSDVELRGNGGMGLRVVRAMNYGGASGPSWTIGLAGVRRAPTTSASLVRRSAASLQPTRRGGEAHRNNEAIGQWGNEAMAAMG